MKLFMRVLVMHARNYVLRPINEWCVSIKGDNECDSSCCVTGANKLVDKIRELISKPVATAGVNIKDA